jgi:hypothetical protein
MDIIQLLYPGTPVRHPVQRQADVHVYDGQLQPLREIVVKRLLADGVPVTVWLKKRDIVCVCATSRDAHVPGRRNCR